MQKGAEIKIELIKGKKLVSKTQITVAIFEKIWNSFAQKKSQRVKRFK